MASGYDNPSHSIAARPWHVDDNPLSLLPLQEARAVAAGVGVRALAMGSSGARGGLAAEVAEAQQEAEAARGRLSALHAALDETRARRAEVEGWDAGAAAESVAGEVGEEAARWVAEAEVSGGEWWRGRP